MAQRRIPFGLLALSAAILSAAAGAVVLARSINTHPDGLWIEVAPPTIVLSDLAPRSVTETATVIRNRGAVPLEVKSLGANCGCTVAKLTAPAIAPYGEVRIPITYRAGEQPGATTRAVFLQVSDPAAGKSRSITVRIQATVRDAHADAAAAPSDS